MDEKNTCETCAFSEIQLGAANDPNEDTKIFCHFNPPIPIVVPVQNHITQEMGINVQIIFPVVLGDSWCGQWAAHTPAILDS